MCADRRVVEEAAPAACLAPPQPAAWAVEPHERLAVDDLSQREHEAQHS